MAPYESSIESYSNNNIQVYKSVRIVYTMRPERNKQNKIQFWMQNSNNIKLLLLLNLIQQQQRKIYFNPLSILLFIAPMNLSIKSIWLFRSTCIDNFAFFFYFFFRKKSVQFFHYDCNFFFYLYSRLPFCKLQIISPLNFNSSTIINKRSNVRLSWAFHLFTFGALI